MKSVVREISSPPISEVTERMPFRTDGSPSLSAKASQAPIRSSSVTSASRAENRTMIRSFDLRLLKTIDMFCPSAVLGNMSVMFSSKRTRVANSANRRTAAAVRPASNRLRGAKKSYRARKNRVMTVVRCV